MPLEGLLHNVVPYLFWQHIRTGFIGRLKLYSESNVDVNNLYNEVANALTFELCSMDSITDISGHEIKGFTGSVGWQNSLEVRTLP